MDTLNAHSEALARSLWSGEGGRRDVWTSIRRGFRGRCPRCGEGRLFQAFLKVDSTCSVCWLDLMQQHADDLPAYLVIAVVGHIVVPIALWVEAAYSLPVWLQLTIYLPATAIASLCLLQPLKGAVVGARWALRTHGFGDGAAEAPPSD
jgi:uncharacterized protein (DUF983 family)